MKCFKCGKEMDNEYGDFTIKGIVIKLSIDDPTPKKIEYQNKQLGKYSDGSGGCDVAICYECYIDAVFQTGANMQQLIL